MGMQASSCCRLSSYDLEGGQSWRQVGFQVSCRPASLVPSHLRSWARGCLEAEVIFLNASLPRLGIASVTLLSLERTLRIHKIFLKN